jgi:hypothetical protein
MAKLQNISFSSIVGPHPLVRTMVRDLHAVTYTASLNDIAPSGLKHLLMLHPLHVVEVNSTAYGSKAAKTAKQPKTYYVMAGFRLYELVSVCRALHGNNFFPRYDFEKIPVIIYPNDREVLDLVRFDLAGSPLLYSLGNKIVTQLTLIKKVMNGFILDILPKYKSIRTMSDDKKEPSVNSADD